MKRVFNLFLLLLCLGAMSFTLGGCENPTEPQDPGPKKLIVE